MRHYLLYLIIIVIFSYSAYSQSSIFLGTCDGYISDMSNNRITGAQVTVTVNGCSGGISNGCTGQDTSQANGYYVVANLNFPASGTLTASATANVGGYIGTGSASTSASGTLPSRANITLCFPPGNPSLINVISFHQDNEIDFDWSSGTDPFGYSTFDQFRIDGGSWQEKSSGFSLNVSYTDHTWYVRTCNKYPGGAVGCCGPATSETFNFLNQVPLPPTLTDQTNIHAENVTLYWTNGTDADGDQIYHEFQLDSILSDNDAYSPVTVTGLLYGTYTWRVRACDFAQCSIWATDDFEVTNSFPTAPILNNIAHTADTDVSFTWTSGTDPEGDTTYDYLQLSSRYDFSNLILDLNPATHPVYFNNLSDFEKYFWKVKTCDSEGCSAWSESWFIKYECDGGEDCQCDGGGSSRGGSSISLPAQKIVETIIPGPPIEVSPPIDATKKEKPEDKEAEKEPIKEEAKELPFSGKLSLKEIVAKNWFVWIILAIVTVSTLIFYGRKRKGKPFYDDERSKEFIFTSLFLIGIVAAITVLMFLNSLASLILLTTFVFAICYWFITYLINSYRGGKSLIYEKFKKEYKI